MSFSVGKRPDSYLENTSFPSILTSKMPRDPSMSLASWPVFALRSAARPAAWGR